MGASYQLRACAPPGIRTKNLRIKKGMTAVGPVRATTSGQVRFRLSARLPPASAAEFAPVRWMKYWMSQPSLGPCDTGLKLGHFDSQQRGTVGLAVRRAL